MALRCDLERLLGLFVFWVVRLSDTKLLARNSGTQRYLHTPRSTTVRPLLQRIHASPTKSVGYESVL